MNKLLHIFIIVIVCDSVFAQQSNNSSIFFNENRGFLAARNWAIRQNNTHEGDFQIGTGNFNTSGLPDFFTSPELAKFTISNNGNVGIGNPNPEVKLDIADAQANGLQFRYDQTPGYRIRLSPYWNTSTDTRLDFNIERVANAGFTTVMSVGYGNNVGIGTTSSDAKLTVKGDIHTQEVRVDLIGAVAPDFVFEKDYNLLPLSEIEAYIHQNKHLPEVPSAKEMEENGLNLKEMNLLLLKKVEELTLHLIEKNKQIEQLQMQNQKIERRLRLIENK
jgi:hypothetical protein